MADLTDVKDFFSNDLYAAQMTGIKIDEAEPGHAKVSLKLDERHKNAVGHIMGAVYFTMADFAFSVATNYDIENPNTVTLTSQITFLSAIQGEMLYATADVIKNGNRTNFCNINIADEFGRCIATVTSTGYRISQK